MTRNRFAQVPEGLLPTVTISLMIASTQMAARNVLSVNELVHDVVVEQAAELMGLAPEAVDPAYGRSQA